MLDRRSASLGVTPAGNMLLAYLSNKSVPDPVGFTQLKDLSDLIIDVCE
jgi:hypothetical protein